MAVVVRISRSSVADPVTALASVSVTFSGVTQQYGIVGYASGRLVALALPPPPASLATKPDPPIVRPYVPGPAPIMVRTPTRPSDGAKVSFPSPEADRLASELAGIETVRSPSTMSPDPPAPRTLPREIVLRKVSTEGIRDLCYTDGRLHVAIGDLGVAVYSLEPVRPVRCESVSLFVIMCA